MQLHSFDDFPFHQHPAPFSNPVTTDAKYNDGYWFGFYGPEYYFVTVLRLHPNVNTIDAGSAVAYGDHQYCVRASRALRPHADDLAVGPVRLEILEPMKRLRLTLDENPAGFRFDVVFEGQAPPFVEERYQHFKYGAMVNDTIRYTQVCRITGTAGLRDTELDVGGWYGLRDHSWGVRTSLGPPTRLGGVDRLEADDRAIRLWVPFQVGDHCGFFQTHEDRTGRTLDFEGRLDYDDGSSVALTGVKHALEYQPGTVRPVGGSFQLLGEDGRTRSYTIRASGPPADVQGIGYYRGWRDGASNGMYRGAELIEHDIYEITENGAKTGPPHVPEHRRLGPTEYPCFMTGPDGGEGMAHVEHHIYGPYDPYSFS